MIDLREQTKNILQSGAITGMWLIEIRPINYPNLNPFTRLRFTTAPFTVDTLNGANAGRYYAGFVAESEAIEAGQSGQSGNSAIKLNFNNQSLAIDTPAIAPYYTADGFFIGLYDGAAVRRTFYSRADLEGSEGDLTFYGFVGDIEIENGIVSLDIRGNTEYLQNTQEFSVTKFCQYRYGSERCGVTPNTYTVTVQGQSSSDPRLLYVNPPSVDPQYLQPGLMAIVSSAATRIDLGYSYTIASIRNDGSFYSVWLDNPLYKLVQAGDQVRFLDGCNKSTDHCRYHNNLARYGGFPALPGNLKVFNSVTI